MYTLLSKMEVGTERKEATDKYIILAFDTNEIQYTRSHGFIISTKQNSRRTHNSVNVLKPEILKTNKFL